MTIATPSQRYTRKLLGTAAGICLTIGAGSMAYAGPLEQAKRMHDRLAGVPPVDQAGVAANQQVISQMAALLPGNPRAAAEIAMANPNFLKVTVKNMVMPWTNEEMTVFTPFNDTAATLVGMVRDGVDFREALYGNIIYVGAGSLGLPAYSNSNNNHYVQMESQNIDLTSANLVQQAQTSVTGVPAAAVSGVLTTRQSARAFFVDGTNRAMFRFTMLNYLCTDLEGIKDTSRIPDRIRQDVSRSPGGDSSVFLNTCAGCHAGMDGLAGAYAYHQWTYSNDAPDSGQMTYTSGTVQPKYLINSTVFPYGYITSNDGWINRWRTGSNANLGWGWGNNTTGQTPTTGNGMQSMGQELANTQAFARCQAIKVYKAVCFSEPSEATLSSLVSNFVSASGNGQYAGRYNMRKLFADSADVCKGN